MSIVIDKIHLASEIISKLHKVLLSANMAGYSSVTVTNITRNIIGNNRVVIAVVFSIGAFVDEELMISLGNKLQAAVANGELSSIEADRSLSIEMKGNNIEYIQLMGLVYC